jgi:hypothetical protein
LQVVGKDYEDLAEEWGNKLMEWCRLSPEEAELNLINIAVLKWNKSAKNYY